MLNVTEQIEISDFLVNLKPILKQRDNSIRILERAKLKEEGFYEVLEEILSELEILENIQLIKSEPNDLDLYEVIVNRFCGEYFTKLSGNNWSNLKSNLMNYGSDRDHLLKRMKTQNLTSTDGTQLNVYSHGNTANNPIIIVLPTGLPMLIMKPWIEILADNYFVVTWETRGMFSPASKNKLNLEAQLEDLNQIIHHFSLQNVHLFGVCHGANLTLHACNELKSKVTSASVWHGDYNWNDDDKLTFIQKNMKRLLEMSDHHVDTADLRSLMTNPKSINKLSENYPIKTLPHIMYPYLTNQIFSSFIELSKDIMSRELKHTVNQINQNILVVTSAKDDTAHSAGSSLLHTYLQRSEFHDRQVGSHISFFEAPEELYNLFTKFY